MKRWVVILIIGICMFVGGRFLSQTILDLAPTNNPAHSALISDADYHMIGMSNTYSTISYVGLGVLVLSGIVFFIDRKKKNK
ncbi:MAG: LPXTG cell wall anchor domain-containing protein [Nitrososphaera sp.]|jgi:LPXTG-motif cell wall-anchored protein